MSGIYWDYHERGSVRLKSYGAVTKGTTSVVKLEIEVTDPSELADILRQCAELQAVKKAKAGKVLMIEHKSGDVS